MARFQLLPICLSSREPLRQRSPQRKLRDSWRNGLCWLHLRVTMMSLLVQTLWRATCSLVARTGCQLSGIPYVEIGPGCSCSRSEHQIPCRRTLAHTKGIQQLRADYPWATLVDLAIFLDGWDMGERFGMEEVRNWGSYSLSSESNTPMSPCAEYTPARTDTRWIGFRGRIVPQIRLFSATNLRSGDICMLGGRLSGQQGNSRRIAASGPVTDDADYFRLGDDTLGMCSGRGFHV